MSGEGDGVQRAIRRRPHPVVREVGPIDNEIQRRFGIFREVSDSNLDLFNTSSEGALHGEGAFYFALSGKKRKETFARIDSISTLYDATKAEIVSGIYQFIQSALLAPEDLDLVLVGKCGDADLDRETEEISKQSFGSVPIGFFKHLSGEYPTASAFALWLGARIIQTRHIPSAVFTSRINQPLRNILIYNPYFKRYHSLILLQAC